MAVFFLASIFSRGKKCKEEEEEIKGAEKCKDNFRSHNHSKL